MSRSRSLRFALRFGIALAFPVLIALGGALPAQEAGDAPRADAPRADAKAAPHDAPRARPDVFLWHPTPWWIAPTSPAKRYPAPFTNELRLGLGFYPVQVGLELPGDASPIEEYRLPAFQGIVRSPQRPEWLYAQQRGAAAAKVTLDQWGIRLLRAGEYKAAGRLQAKGFRDSDDPRYPLHLAESLFGLGKFRHAEMVLRHALDQPATYAHLPDEVASHFPSVVEFEGKLAALLEAKDAPLLSAYLLLFSRDGTKGLDVLQDLMAKDPKDEVPARLYRHYLDKAFGAPEPAKAEEPEQAEPKPES